MASAETQKPACPACNQSDEVKTMQAAYEAGVDKCAPPDMPTRHVSMIPYILFSAIIVGICVFLIVVLIGGMESGLPVIAQGILLSIAFICIVAALVISFLAFQRVVNGDAEATVQFPAWDRAMTTWKSVYYCARDNVVFDPKTGKVLTNAQLAILRSMDEQSVEAKSAAIAAQ
ncbi:MAG TPA: hypothetical protein VHZ51_27155 [Ktedonobacteraceae bacterium]|jgi:hypothetical protein|nr:hypothetical protein [Ktedonobacteraceae bacterium]